MVVTGEGILPLFFFFCTGDNSSGSPAQVLPNFHFSAELSHVQDTVNAASRVSDDDDRFALPAQSVRKDMFCCSAGTPVQNNITELWTLLKFLNPYWEWCVATC